MLTLNHMLFSGPARLLYNTNLSVAVYNKVCSLFLSTASKISDIF